MLCLSLCLKRMERAENPNPPRRRESQKGGGPAGAWTRRKGRETYARTCNANSGVCAQTSPLEKRGGSGLATVTSSDHARSWPPRNVARRSPDYVLRAAGTVISAESYRRTSGSASRFPRRGCNHRLAPHRSTIKNPALIRPYRLQICSPLKLEANAHDAGSTKLLLLTPKPVTTCCL